MSGHRLDGLTFLVVEDEPLIAMDLAMALEDEGAKVTTTTTLKHAMLLAEHDGLAGAIIDHSLGDGDSTALQARLKERGIPFLIHSGYEVEGEPYLPKPATPDQLVAALQRLLEFGQ
jgi:DNA-binding response OmpR family regulator